MKKYLSPVLASEQLHSQKIHNIISYLINKK